jgi:hypothetical protein
VMSRINKWKRRLHALVHVRFSKVAQPTSGIKASRPVIRDQVEKFSMFPVVKTTRCSTHPDAAQMLLANPFNSYAPAAP